MEEGSGPGEKEQALVTDLYHADLIMSAVSIGRAVRHHSRPCP